MFLYADRRLPFARRFLVPALIFAALLPAATTPCRAADSFWFTGETGTLGSFHLPGGVPVSFHLIGGNYSLYVYAKRPVTTPSDPASRSCLFTGVFARVSETPDILRLGTVVPISTIVPYKLGPKTLNLAAGVYQLYITRLTNCDWKFVINSTSDNSAGITPVVMLKRVSDRVNATGTAALAEAVEFIAQYRTARDEKAPVSGTVELMHDQSVFRSAPLNVGKDVANGGDRLFADISFSPEDAKYLGKNTVRFNVKIGGNEFTSTGEFTLTR